jgi:hypothetical protein
MSGVKSSKNIVYSQINNKRAAAARQHQQQQQYQQHTRWSSKTEAYLMHMQVTSHFTLFIVHNIHIS